jgi:hypothetical protein
MLLDTRRVTLREAIELNRADALDAAADRASGAATVAQ